MPRPELGPGDRIVIKVGTTSLTDAAGRPDEGRIAALCDGIAGARVNGVQVVLVSSGAIAAGLAPLGLASRPVDIPTLQAAAAVGQGRLMRIYARSLHEREVTPAQILLTRHDFMDRQRYINARNTIDRLLTLGALPVVNENDTVAVDEIRFGDNDRLAALVSNLVRPKLLLLLTDRGGIHATDPRRDPSAPILDEVEKITPELEKAAGRTTGLGSGGMASKIAAAWVATFSGVGVLVAGAAEEDVIARVARGERLGTYLHPRPTRASARRLWIAFGQPPKGTVSVDDGARHAVLDMKRSLLPVGVTTVEGDFERGDPVDVADATGEVFARGLVRYAAPDLRSAVGRASDEASGEVINRDQLVVLLDPSSGR